MVRTLLFAAVALLMTAGAAAATPETVARDAAPGEVALNPQPDPPMPRPNAPGGFLPDFDVFGFNPQPEPPAAWHVRGAAANIDSRLAAVGFNPQPEPPGTPGDGGMASHAGRVTSGLEQVGFNPQPEPPAAWHVRGAAANVDSRLAAVGFNPQPEPPGTPQLPG